MQSGFAQSSLGLYLFAFDFNYKRSMIFLVSLYDSLTCVCNVIKIGSSCTIECILNTILTTVSGCHVTKILTLILALFVP